MAAREKLAFRKSKTVRLVAPVDRSVTPKNPLDNTTDGATCSFKVFDADKDEVLSALEAIGQTILSVTNAGEFVVGDVVELDQDNGTIHASAINTVTSADGTITIDDPTTVAASAGNRIRVRLGAVITMTEFGTPKLGSRDYGFAGTLAWNHAGLKLDQHVDIERTLVFGALQLLDVSCHVIKTQKDCCT